MVTQRLIDDALNTLEAAWPGRKFKVDHTTWHYAVSDRAIHFEVSMLPGLNGKPCTIFYDITLAGAVAQCLAALPNDLDDTAEFEIEPHNVLIAS
jgi:hypothetical protein